MSAAGNPQTSTRWAEEKKIRFRRWLGGIIGVTFAIYLLTLAGSGPLLGLLAFFVSAVAGFVPSAALRAERGKIRHAQKVWNEAKREFTQDASNLPFLQLRQDVDALIAQLQEANSEERRKLDDLTNTKTRISTSTLP